MFRKVDLWAVCLIVLLGLAGTILFGGAVLFVERGAAGLGGAGRIAHAVAEVPLTVRQLFEPDARMNLFPQRFDGIPGGWSFGEQANAPALDGYVLLSRIDGDADRHTVELTSLADWTVRYRWTFDAGAILADAPRDTEVGETSNWTTPEFRAIHPLVTQGGGLIVKDHYSPIFAIDACGAPVWRIDRPVFSHSTETDAEGDLWVPGHPDPAEGSPWRANFHDDSLVRLSPDGKILSVRSIPELLTEKGLRGFLFDGSSYREDPIHLNDIQPVREDGPYWRKGDLFLSLRGPSTIMLYRPSTDEIVWMKSGPWLQQHDVDILDDHRISVFSNNTVNFGRHPRVDTASGVMIYDFATDSVSEPWKKTMTDLKIATTFEGLADILPDGSVMIEEENSGRIVILAADGRLLAQYLNRTEDGRIFRLGWSRYIPQSEGDAILSALAATSCPAAP